MNYKRLTTSSVLVLCALHFFVSSETRAAIVMIQNFSFSQSNAPQFGSVDIFIADDGTLPIDVAAFQLKVDLVGGDAGTVLTGFGSPQSRSYVFAGSANSPAGLISNGAKTLEAGDFLNAGTRQVVGGEGLGSVQFSVPANATQGFRLSLSLNPQDTFIANGQGALFPIAFAGGQVAVAVPEPSAAAALILLPLAGLWSRRRRNPFVC